MRDIELTLREKPIGKLLVRDLEPGTLFLLPGSAVLMKLVNGVVNMDCRDIISPPADYDNCVVVKVIAKQRNATIDRDADPPKPREMTAGDLPPGGYGIDLMGRVWFRPCKNFDVLQIKSDSWWQAVSHDTASFTGLTRWFQGPEITAKLFEEDPDDED
jgi:hypothetical protein